MSHSNPSNERLGAVLATALGVGPSRATIALQRARLIEQSRELAQRRSRFWSFLLVPVLAGALVAAFFWLRSPTALEASLSGAKVATASRVESRPDGAESLRFSDGSEVVLEPATLAEISRLDAKRADLRLERGRIRASIEPKTGATWTIAVGPYSVRVVGTRFSVDWDRERRLLKVEVSEGRVRVFGGDIPGEGVALDAGGRLERRYAAPEPAREAAPRAPSPPEPADAATAEEANPRAEAAALGLAPAEPKWLALASKGKYREALALAEKQGFDELTVSLPENDLLVLANAARFTGDAARAQRALLKLRQRFAGRPAAELAALYLARVAEDLSRSPSETARWLRVFLQESPTGDLAAGARVNLMSILLRSGDRAGARAIAEDYVRYHPGGPQASQARALIEQTPTR